MFLKPCQIFKLIFWNMLGYKSFSFKNALYGWYFLTVTLGSHFCFVLQHDFLNWNCSMAEEPEEPGKVGIT